MIRNGPISQEFLRGEEKKWDIFSLPLSKILVVIPFGWGGEPFNQLFKSDGKIED
jgi:hypothetical protein